MFSNKTNTSLTLSDPIYVKMDMATNISKSIRELERVTIKVIETPVWRNRTITDNVEEADNGKQIIVAAALVILAFIILICALLCYREISRRRLEAELLEEYLRKEEIRRSIKTKIAQMKSLDESDSYMEEMRLKVPLVTFGDVTRISPTNSFETLHLQSHHFHHHHHHYNHHHHHHHIYTERIAYKDNKNTSIVRSGKDRQWSASTHYIPTRGRFLSFILGKFKRTNGKRGGEKKDLEMALQLREDDKKQYN